MAAVAEAMVDDLAQGVIVSDVGSVKASVLNALTAATTLLGEEISGEERREMGAICARMLADMSQILNELLDFSALVAGRAKLTLSRFSLPALFGEIVLQWQSVAEEGGMTFTSRCDPALGEIVSDPLKLRQPALQRHQVSPSCTGRRCGGLLRGRWNDGLEAGG